MLKFFKNEKDELIFKSFGFRVAVTSDFEGYVQGSRLLAATGGEKMRWNDYGFQYPYQISNPLLTKSHAREENVLQCLIEMIPCRLKVYDWSKFKIGLQMIDNRFSFTG